MRKDRALKSFVPPDLPTDFFKKRITFLNFYSYLFFRGNRSLFNEFDYIMFDGATLVLASKLFRINTKRYSFDMTSVAPLLFEKAVANGLRLALVGGETGVVEKASAYFQSCYPELKIIKTRHGYFSSPQEFRLTALEFAEAAPDVLIVGMGTPHQEKFLNAVFATGWSGGAFTCGGFFHQTASHGIQYYPPLFNALNLRWLYRMIDEPKLIRRYVASYPKALFLFFYDMLLIKWK